MTLHPYFVENSVARVSPKPPVHTLSIDGSGSGVSVCHNVARQLVEYIQKKFGPTSVLDVGTGCGFLVQALVDAGLDGYGIEGSSSLVSSIACDKNRYAIVDATLPLDKRLYKSFDLTTSFEVFEHIHRSHEDQFIRNLAYLADWHFCSIHMWGWPGTDSKHCNIKHECCWMEVFRKHGIKPEVLGHARTTAVTDEGRTMPGHLAVTFDKNTYCDVRANVNFNAWNEWEWSMFCVLDMRECKV